LIKYSRHCEVCGDPLVLRPGVHDTYQKRTCNSRHCLSVLMLTPKEFYPPKKYPGEMPGFKRNKTPDLVGPAPLVEASGLHPVPEANLPRVVIDTSAMLNDEILTADLRGLGDVASRDPWGFGTRVRVAFRVREKPGSIFLYVLRRPEETSAQAVRRELGDSSTPYDHWLLWRCSCKAQVEYRLATMDDLPDTAGPHGNCANCGATAVFVEVVEVLP
jgi:hypothetical protein